MYWSGIKRHTTQYIRLWWMYCLLLSGGIGNEMILDGSTVILMNEKQLVNNLWMFFYMWLNMCLSVCALFAQVWIQWPNWGHIKNHCSCTNSVSQARSFFGISISLTRPRNPHEKDTMIKIPEIRIEIMEVFRN